MPGRTALSFSAASLAVLALASSLAACGTPEPMHTLPRPDMFAQAAGTVASTSKQGVPLNLRWEQLSDEQKAVVRGWYVDMPAGDEPPYPRAGLRPVIEAVWRGQRRMLETGDLLVVATVDGRGEVQEVQAFGTPNKALIDYISRVVIQTRFKPAVCGGTPCRMDFPLKVQLQVE